MTTPAKSHHESLPFDPYRMTYRKRQLGARQRRRSRLPDLQRAEYDFLRHQPLDAHDNGRFL